MSYASIIGSGNHIFKGASEYSVILRGYGGVYPCTVDLRNNYWGTEDEAAIAEMIFDGNDDPEIEKEVLFLPFSAEPLAKKKPSLGGFKSMFRWFAVWLESSPRVPPEGRGGGRLGRKLALRSLTPDLESMV